MKILVIGIIIIAAVVVLGWSINRLYDDFTGER